MTNASIKNMFAALSMLAVSLAFSMGAFAIVAHAQEDNIGYFELGGGTYVPDYVNTYVPDYTNTYTPDYTNTYWPDYTNTYTPDYTNTYIPDYTNTYIPDYQNLIAGCDCYSQIVDGVVYRNFDTSYSPSYSIPSYTSPRPQSYSFAAPSTYYAPSYPAPQQQQQQQQQQQSSTPINIVNTNNNNNVNNNVNTNTVSVVVPVSQTPVTYPIQYVYPQPTPVCPTGTTGIYPNCIYPTPVSNLYCTITASPTSITNGQASYLTWSSSGATSAWISDGIGSVAVNGSLTVRPNTSKTYTLTVTGLGGTRTCSTYVTVSGSYVSLSQIPYTGFDFGPLGNALYWLALLSFAAAGAYLVVYYLPHNVFGKAGKGGVLALASIGNSEAPLPVEPTPAPEAPTLPARTTDVVQSGGSSLQNLPVFEAQPVEATRIGTTDSMIIAHAKNGSAPRIVITRN